MVGTFPPRTDLERYFDLTEEEIDRLLTAMKTQEPIHAMRFANHLLGGDGVIGVHDGTVWTDEYVNDWNWNRFAALVVAMPGRGKETIHYFPFTRDYMVGPPVLTEEPAPFETKGRWKKPKPSKRCVCRKN